jgi:hypothetical protein
MRWLGWTIAALAGVVIGCTDGNALYTSSKLVPGYTPSGGKPPMALAYLKEQERKATADWREH